MALLGQFLHSFLSPDYPDADEPDTEKGHDGREEADGGEVGYRTIPATGLESARGSRPVLRDLMKIIDGHDVAMDVFQLGVKKIAAVW